jgi:hypothetical protein
VDKLADLLGYGTAFIYAAAAYKLFNWLDVNASKEAKSALARTMGAKGLKAKEVSVALLETFDRVYTHPLLGWRAFFRSSLFTLVLTVLLFIETRSVFWIFDVTAIAKVIGTAFVTNVATDYLALFIVRPWLGWCGNKPVFALLSGTLLALMVVCIGLVARDVMTGVFFFPPLPPTSGQEFHDYQMRHLYEYEARGTAAGFENVATLPALAVYIWLPLFALGILAARALIPVSRIVAKVQWFLNEGNEHPLRAIGCVAAVVVFGVVIAWRTALES